MSKQRLIKNKAGENSTKVLNEPEMALSLESRWLFQSIHS